MTHMRVRMHIHRRSSGECAPMSWCDWLAPVVAGADPETDPPDGA